MDRVWRFLTSMRTTAGVLIALAALMVVNVVVPQEATREAAYRELVSRGPSGRFLLETLGLGHVSTSPVFLATLWFFFLTLAAALADRTAATLRRARVKPPPEASLSAMVASNALELTGRAVAGPDTARRVLEVLGYRVVPMGERGLWAVKHPAAVLGFPIFHLSFFVLCLGGAQLHYTRQVASVTVVEGQSFDEGSLRLVRRAPGGGAPPVRMTLERVDVDLEDGQPVRLGATLRPSEPGAVPGITRINHPAEWGALSILVDGAGLAPVLRLADRNGFTIDRVAVVVANASGPVTAKLGDGAISATVAPIPIGPSFPERDALPHARLRVAIREGERTPFDGMLAAGVPVAVGDRRVEIEEIRYWASLWLVHEHGGGLLVLGFVLAVVGIVWRMVWFRREVAVVWGDGSARLAGRGEFYPSRVREELERVRSLLEDPRAVGIVGANREGGA